jgi:hypothetical protein
MTGTVASADRRLTLAILTTWGVLCALQYGGLPFGRYAWAVNLWAYQPVAVGLVLASLALSISAGSVRRSLIGALDRVNLRIGKNALIPLAAGAGAALLFWLLTGDDLSPDARVFGGAVMSGYDFIFPDMGATWIIFRLSWLALILDLPVFSLVRVASCLSGGTTVALLISMSRRGMLGPVRPFGLSTGLLLSAGLVRTFVGRVETYPFLLVAVAVYVWLALRFLHTGRGWYITCFVAGIAVWLHAAAVGLALSLAVLPRLVTRDLALGNWLGKLVRGALVASLPSFVFIAGAVTIGDDFSLKDSVATAVEILGGNESDTATRWWVRGWGGEPSIGTDVVFASQAQFKYLANAAFLLCPSAIPVLLFLFAVGGRKLGRDATAIFLAALCLPLIVYAFALRPFWGPYDWDLFSIAGFALILFQAYALELVIEPFRLRHVAVWLVSFQLFFVGAPFVLLSEMPQRNAGPFFMEDYMSPEIGRAATPAPPALEPWL